MPSRCDTWWRFYLSECQALPEGHMGTQGSGCSASMAWWSPLASCVPWEEESLGPSRPQCAWEDEGEDGVTPRAADSSAWSQDTQEFLRCLMDQLHEELKEPAVATVTVEARDSDSSDTDEKREGDRSPSEDEFLSCDSSSDRGEGDGQGRGGGSSQAETELLIPDEAGRAISEKERMKDRKFSWGQQRTNSEQVDEDADVDTAMAALGEQPSESQPPSPRSTSPCRTPGTRSPGCRPSHICPGPLGGQFPPLVETLCPDPLSWSWIPSQPRRTEPSVGHRRDKPAPLQCWDHREHIGARPQSW